MATVTPGRSIAPTLPFLLLLLLLLLPPSAATSEHPLSPSVTTIDVSTADRLLTRLTSPYRFLDVRTTKEFAHGHVERAVNVPYVFFTEGEGDSGTVRNPEFIHGVEREFAKGDPIIVGCLAGVRSLKAAEELVGAGFRDVKDLGGGYRAWLDKELPLVRASPASRHEAAEL